MADNGDGKNDFNINLDVKPISKFLEILKESLKLLDGNPPIARFNVFLDILAIAGFILCASVLKSFVGIIPIDFYPWSLAAGLIVLILFWWKCFRYCAKRVYFIEKNKSLPSSGAE
jgi:hypothetical protein